VVDADDLDFDLDGVHVMADAQTGGDDKAEEVDAEIYARLARAVPGPQQVVAAAYRAAGLDRNPLPALAHRVHLAALIPTIGLRAGEDATWHNVDDPTISQVAVFDVSATWQLGRLVVDPVDFQVVSATLARNRERRRLSTRVLRLYYRWLAARAVAERTGRASTRADEAAAELDAWTEGWWSLETCHVAKCAPSSGR
jgi:hypothetical protein